MKVYQLKKYVITMQIKASITVPSAVHHIMSRGIKVETVRIRCRQTVSSCARKLISFVAHCIHEIPVVHIAQFFEIRPQSVSQLIKQVEPLAKGCKLN